LGEGRRRRLGFGCLRLTILVEFNVGEAYSEGEATGMLSLSLVRPFEYFVDGFGEIHLADFLTVALRHGFLHCFGKPIRD
jgi:hypothetical protein